MIQVNVLLAYDVDYFPVKANTLLTALKNENASTPT